MLIALLAIILTLLLVVGLHEAGHAIAARIFGIKIETISIGFGKPIVKWRKNGVEWVWAMWPLGGYVKLLNSRIHPVKPQDYPYCFDKKPVWVRIVVLFSGAFVNLILAWAALFFYFSMDHQQQIPVVKQVVTNSVAAGAGIKSGDRIIGVDQHKTDSWQDVGMYLVSHLDNSAVPIKVIGSNNTHQNYVLNLKDLPMQGNLLTAIGIVPAESQEYLERVSGQDFIEAANFASFKLKQLLWFFLIILKQLLTGKIPFSVLLGPVGLLSASILSFKQGLAVFLYFIATLSLAVGLVNLFPIPGLDGGSIIFALIEKISGRPISVALEILLYRLALIAFFLFLVQLLLNDLQRYLR
ncbi:membrane associated zinc metalloprotease [Legionella quinlivanii]|uniref:Membrane associated zinc metalloprotease n=1 Tax=Legionella quinlivanii TaxID=45073 RepID=A0A0W0Y0J1_9GAMM|nr:site-2 protease family protein [Legionella quinlivanii]KTD50314.1 membrane associated zinc metalloprotease [Legionella quinlivanii]SEF43773.1 regulator of sigma E protease [Legionella quinlivanii DSM 21216]STY11914.1 membrane associated zinc metalloprotease [Legionella quinlivanii]